MWKANCLDLVFICKQLGPALIAVPELCGWLQFQGSELEESSHRAAVLAALHTEVAVWPLFMQRLVSPCIPFIYILVSLVQLHKPMKFH